MKTITSGFLAVVMLILAGIGAGSVLTSSAEAGTSFGFKGQKFHKEYWFAKTATGDGSGHDASNKAAIGTAVTVDAIDAGTLIERVYLVIDTAVTGTTVLNVGDDDSSNGFCPTASVTLGTPGLYCYDAGKAGSYLRATTQSGSTPNVVAPNAKYYSAAGKSILLATTTANTAGAFRIVVEGTRLYQ